MALCDIVDGPSKFDLMLALFDGDGKHRRTVAFLLENTEAKQGSQEHASLNFIINEVEREDDSGEKWLFTATYLANVDRGRVRGSFSTRTRKGWISL